MIVSDLFQFDLFPDFRLVGGGEGLGREVRTVLVFDAPDIGYWIRGGEFLLSNGYVFKDDPDKFLRFMDELAGRDVAGLGVKFGRFLSTDFMKEVHREADRIGLPVIHMPFHYDWTDIYERILPRLNPAQRRQVPTDGPFAIDGDTDLETLLSRLCAYLERDLVFSARKKGIHLYFSYPFPFADSQKGQGFGKVPIEEERPFPRIGSLSAGNVKRSFAEKLWWAAYATGTAPLFELNVEIDRGDRRLSEREEQVIIRAMAILRVLMTEESLRLEHSMDEAEKLVEQVVLGAHVDARDIEKVSRAWRADPAFPMRVVLCYGCGPERYPLWRKVFDHLACRLGDLHVGLVPERRIEQVEPDLLRLEASALFGPSAGELSEISDSFVRAKEALFWLKNRKVQPGCYRYENIIVDREMEGFAHRDGAEEIWRRYWRPLVANPPRQAVSLEAFARELIRTNFNLRACSRNLAVHYNTGRNYLAILEGLLSISLEDPRDRFGFVLAERIADFREGFSGLRAGESVKP